MSYAQDLFMAILGVERRHITLPDHRTGFKEPSHRLRALFNTVFVRETLQQKQNAISFQFLLGLGVRL